MRLKIIVQIMFNKRRDEIFLSSSCDVFKNSIFSLSQSPTGPSSLAPAKEGRQNPCSQYSNPSDVQIGVGLGRLLTETSNYQLIIKSKYLAESRTSPRCDFAAIRDYFYGTGIPWCLSQSLYLSDPPIGDGL